MDSNKFIQGVLKTEAPVTPEMTKRISEPKFIRLDHAADGLCTEAGEFKDTLKKYKFYGTPVDEVNLIEELGDLLYYCALACDVLHISFEDVMQINNKKLKARYPDKFSQQNAENRDLNKERKILENKKQQKTLYKFFWDCGRSGEVESIFISTKTEIDKIIGKEVYFGEILGKHSDIYGKINEEDISILSEDQNLIQKLEGIIKSDTISGHNPLWCIEEENDE